MEDQTTKNQKEIISFFEERGYEEVFDTYNGVREKSTWLMFKKDKNLLIRVDVYGSLHCTGYKEGLHCKIEESWGGLSGIQNHPEKLEAI
jgi:hypothetical protein